MIIRMVTDEAVMTKDVVNKQHGSTSSTLHGYISTMGYSSTHAETVWLVGQHGVCLGRVDVVYFEREEEKRVCETADGADHDGDEEDRNVVILSHPSILKHV